MPAGWANGVLIVGRSPTTAWCRLRKQGWRVVRYGWRGDWRHVAERRAAFVAERLARQHRCAAGWTGGSGGRRQRGHSDLGRLKSTAGRDPRAALLAKTIRCFVLSPACWTFHDSSSIKTVKS